MSLIDAYGRTIESSQEGAEDVYRCGGLEVRRPHGDPAESALRTFNSMPPPREPEPPPMPVLVPDYGPGAPLVGAPESVTSEQWTVLGGFRTNVDGLLAAKPGYPLGVITGSARVLGTGSLELRLVERDDDGGPDVVLAGPVSVPADAEGKWRGLPDFTTWANEPRHGERDYELEGRIVGGAEASVRRVMAVVASLREA